MIAGSPDVEVPPAIAVKPDDFVSARCTGVTAFYGTNLDSILRLNRVETIVLTGVSSNVALPGLAMEAVSRGYRIVIPEDATAGISAVSHAFMFENLLSVLGRISTTSEVARIVAGEEST